MSCANMKNVNCPNCGADCLDTLDDVVVAGRGGCEDIARIPFQCSEGCGVNPILVLHNHKGQLQIVWEMEGRQLPFETVS